jgi:hypothetical protein
MTSVRTVAKKLKKIGGEVLISFFGGLTLDGKSMSLRLKFLGFYNQFFA